MLKPLGDRILIKPIKNADETDSGLVLVEHRKPETMGEVVQVGFCASPYRAEAERLAEWLDDQGDMHIEAANLLRTLTGREPLVKAGDTVWFPWTAGRELNIVGDEDLEDGMYLIMNESDILAVLEPEPAPLAHERNDCDWVGWP